MFEQILFPTDGSDGAAFAFDHVLDLAARYDATVYIVNVVDTAQNRVLKISDTDVDALEQEGDRIVREAAEKAQQRGVDIVTDVLQGEPYREIVDYAERHGFDLVVMPTHGRRGLERFLLGSTTDRVVRRADVPVLTIRPDDDVEITYPYTDVLVPTDGSDCANQALALGVDIVDAEDATLHLLSAITISALGVDIRVDMQLEMLEESAHNLLDEAATFADDAGVKPTSKTVEYGPSIHKAILTYIEEHDIDLVVVGTTDVRASTDTSLAASPSISFERRRFQSWRFEHLNQTTKRSTEKMIVFGNRLCSLARVFTVLAICGCLEVSKLQIEPDCVQRP